MAEINLLAFVIIMSILVIILIAGMIVLFLVKQNKNSSNTNGPQGIKGPQGFQGKNDSIGAQGSQGPQGVQGLRGFQGQPNDSTTTTYSIVGFQDHILNATDQITTSFSATNGALTTVQFEVGWQKISRVNQTSSLATISCSTVQVWPKGLLQKELSFNVTLRDDFKLNEIDQRVILGFSGYGSFANAASGGTNFINLVSVQIVPLSQTLLRLTFRLAPATGNTTTSPPPPFSPLYTIQYSITYTAVP